jgi:hypothetical protein
VSFIVGVDLGQAQDYTAIVVIEKVGEENLEKAPLHVRHLERPPLGTYYDEQVERVKEIVTDPALGGEEIYDEWGELMGRRPPELVVDFTGVGRPVADMMRKEELSLTPILIHGGDGTTRDGAVWRVPKRDLVSAAQIALQSGRLGISRELELAEALRRELLNFKVKINIATAHDSYEAWRERDHDDLVLATALACWKATRRQQGAVAYSFPYSVR